MATTSSGGWSGPPVAATSVFGHSPAAGLDAGITDSSAVAVQVGSPAATFAGPQISTFASPSTGGSADLDTIRLASATANAGPQYRFPIWRVLLAVFLLVTGFCMVISGIAVESVVVGIVGAILMLPGGYMCFVYLQVYRGDPRFRAQDWLERRDDFD